MTEKDRGANEQQQLIVLKEGFWISKYEVSVAQWNSVEYTNIVAMSEHTRLPKTNVSWFDCVDWIRKLNSSEISPDLFFALPSEAQWEYACRAGDSRPFSGTGNLKEMGWYTNNSGGRLHRPGLKQPNQWGIYDMHGNVWEWCSDLYLRFPKRSGVDGAAETFDRSLKGKHSRRGGAYSYVDCNCRSAMRGSMFADEKDIYAGFRLVAKKREGKVPTKTESIFLPDHANNQSADSESKSGIISVIKAIIRSLK